MQVWGLYEFAYTKILWQHYCYKDGQYDLSDKYLYNIITLQSIMNKLMLKMWLPASAVKNKVPVDQICTLI